MHPSGFTVCQYGTACTVQVMHMLPSFTVCACVVMAMMIFQPNFSAIRRWRSGRTHDSFFRVFRRESVEDLPQMALNFPPPKYYKISRVELRLRDSKLKTSQPDTNIFLSLQTSTKRSLKTFVHCVSVCKHLRTLNKHVKKVCVLAWFLHMH